MRRFSPGSLEDIGISIFTTLGCTESTARTVSEHLVESCLFGQEGHGLIRFYEYAKQTWEGNFDPKAEPTVISDRACTGRRRRGRRVRSGRSPAGDFVGH